MVFPRRIGLRLNRSRSIRHLNVELRSSEKVIEVVELDPACLASVNSAFVGSSAIYRNGLALLALA